MILIFSKSNDPSTLDVIRWIHRLSDARVVRINADETYDVDITFRDDDYLVAIDGDGFRLADVSSAWLRKGSFWFSGLFPQVPVDAAPSRAFAQHVEHRLRQEDMRLREHFHYVLRRRCAVLGSAMGSSPNKLTVLEMARELGLRTPPFCVSSSRQQAQDLVDSGVGYISKAMSDGIYLFDVHESRRGYFTYTEALEEGSLDGLEPRMAPSFFQRYVDKAFELRVFFLDDVFRAVAIFSQNDEQTRIDYRKYNDQTPNRMVPYLLPSDVQRKLTSLAERLGLNTGSIDLIVDHAGEHYFLEVNPVGQFGPLSEACNLSIERLIAERLVSRDH